MNKNSLHYSYKPGDRYRRVRGMSQPVTPLGQVLWSNRAKKEILRKFHCAHQMPISPARVQSRGWWETVKRVQMHKVPRKSQQLNIHVHSWWNHISYIATPITNSTDINWQAEITAHMNSRQYPTILLSWPQLYDTGGIWKLNVSLTFKELLNNEMWLYSHKQRVINTEEEGLGI